MLRQQHANAILSLKEYLQNQNIPDRRNATTSKKIPERFEKITINDLNAYKLTVDESKHAMVLMLNKDDFVSDITEEMETLTHACGATSFVQDYRGRGDNAAADTIETELFDADNYEKDVTDQAALIKDLVENQGYQPKNIIIYSVGYGVLVAVGALCRLMESNESYANLKLYSKQLYGNAKEFSEIEKLSLRFKHLPPLQASDWVEALLFEKPIFIDWSYQFPNVTSYSLYKDSIPVPDNVIMNKVMSHSKTSTVLTKLINELHQYCFSRANEAYQHHQGLTYKHRLFGQWTVGQQIHIALRIMKALATRPEPDWRDIEVTQLSKGPQQSGELQKIMTKITELDGEASQVETMNKIIERVKKKGAQDVMKERIKNILFTDINNKEESEQPVECPIVTP